MSVGERSLSHVCCITEVEIHLFPFCSQEVGKLAQEDHGNKRAVPPPHLLHHFRRAGHALHMGSTVERYLDVEVADELALCVVCYEVV